MKRELMANMGFRILALALAVGMWFYITKGLGLERNVEEKVFKDVEVKMLSSGERDLIAKVRPGKIELRLRGKRSALKGLITKKILAFVDVSTFEEGKYERIPITLNLPEGVKVVTEPPACEVILERR